MTAPALDVKFHDPLSEEARYIQILVRIEHEAVGARQFPGSVREDPVEGEVVRVRAIDILEHGTVEGIVGETADQQIPVGSCFGIRCIPSPVPEPGRTTAFRRRRTGRSG